MLKKLSDTRYQIDAKLSWAFISKPETRLKYKKDDEYETVYRVNGEFSKEDLFELMMLRTTEGIGQDLKKDEKTGIVSFQFRRFVDVDTATNEPVSKLVVKGPDGNPLEDGILLGNGSEGVIAFALKPYSNDKTKHKVILEGVKITKLVIFEGGGGQAENDPVPENLFDDNNPDAAF